MCLIFLCQGNEDLVVVHDALEFGHCRLSLAVCWYPGGFIGTSLVISN